MYYCRDLRKALEEFYLHQQAYSIMIWSATYSFDLFSMVIFEERLEFKYYYDVLAQITGSNAIQDFGAV